MGLFRSSEATLEMELRALEEMARELREEHADALALRRALGRSASVVVHLIAASLALVLGFVAGDLTTVTAARREAIRQDTRDLAERAAARATVLECTQGRFEDRSRVGLCVDELGFAERGEIRGP